MPTSVPSRVARVNKLAKAEELRRAKPVPEAAAEPTAKKDKNAETLAERLRQRSLKAPFGLWIVGKTPLIAHAWSQKAKEDMLKKHQKLTVASREIRDPYEDFNNSLYRDPDGAYCFPAMAIKEAIVSVAHKDKGIAKSDVQRAFHLRAELIRAYTAQEDAICDMPVVRLWGSKPVMREDMAKVGMGLNKTATLVYRAQFTYWAIYIRGTVNPNIIPVEALKKLIDEAGEACGIGDWRNERSGMFGAFRLAMPDEEEAWTNFARDPEKVSMPIPVDEEELA